VLLFGLVLGNEFRLFRRVTTTTWQLGGEMRRFHGEIVFFFRAFFFVGLGVLVDPRIFADPLGLTLAALVLVPLVLARAAAVTLMCLGWSDLRPTRTLAVLMMPRDLAAAVLATVPAVAAVPGSSAFVSAAFIVIMATNAATLLAPLAPRPAAAAPQPDGVVQALQMRERQLSEEDEARAKLNARAQRLDAEMERVSAELAALGRAGAPPLEGAPRSGRRGK
jgi:NhaP-type Na+/H+ or K+/H+ antiporter